MNGNIDARAVGHGSIIVEVGGQRVRLSLEEAKRLSNRLNTELDGGSP